MKALDPPRPAAPVPGSMWARLGTAGDDRPLSAQGLLRALLVVGALLLLLFNWRGLGGVVFGLALATMILLHEAGHFVAAKAAGMKVTQFFIGFGPRLWSFRRGETEYGIKILPLGGFVRVIGMHNLEEVPPEDEARTYRAASFPRRLAMVCAGSFVHLMLALGLFLIVLCGLGVQDVSTTVEALPHAKNAPPTPAQLAGLRPGDKIEAIGGVATATWDDVRLQIAASKGRLTPFEIRRAGRTLTLPVQPQTYAQCGASRPYVGIQPGLRTYRTGPTVAVRAVGAYAGATFEGIKGFFSLSHLHRYSSTLSNASNQPVATVCAVGGVGDPYRFISPKGAVDIGAQAFKNGARPFLELLAGLNVSIGLLNMLPLLPLDGGHAVLAMYERLRSRKRRYRADIMKLVPLTWAVVAILLTVGVSSLYLDIKQPPVSIDRPSPVPVAVPGGNK